MKEIKMKNSLLPIGSVVLLKDANKRLMICGRVQTDVATDKTYDYSACLYPEGIVDSDSLYLFNNGDIQQVYFIGFQDAEELQFKKFLVEQLSQAGEGNVDGK